MRFGLHILLKGGFEKNVKRAAELGCSTIQMFAGNPTAWKPATTNPDLFKKRGSLLREIGIYPLVIHAAYLANLASPREDFYQKTLVLIRDTMLKASLYGSPYVVVHMGNHGGEGVGKGLDLLIRTLDKEMSSFPSGVTLLLENTPGGGNELGGEIAHLRVVFQAFPGEDVPLGVCLDTAHLWSAGYDLSEPKKVAQFLDEFNDEVGLEKIKAVHVNDTSSPLGSHRDRHEHIGQGFLKDGFPALFECSWPADFPFILETPEIGTEMDQLNLQNLKKAAVVEG